MGDRLVRSGLRVLFGALVVAAIGCEAHEPHGRVGEEDPPTAPQDCESRCAAAARRCETAALMTNTECLDREQESCRAHALGDTMFCGGSPGSCRPDYAAESERCHQVATECTDRCPALRQPQVCADGRVWITARGVCDCDPTTRVWDERMWRCVSRDSAVTVLEPLVVVTRRPASEPAVASPSPSP